MRTEHAVCALAVVSKVCRAAADAASSTRKRRNFRESVLGLILQSGLLLR